MILDKAQLRNYEVSVWTLQDEFLTVLKPYQLEHKSYLIKPHFGLKDDGTQTFTFSIPMYLREEKELRLNPIWKDVKNKHFILIGLQKIKVIFNKDDTNLKKCFEFIILDIKESHEKDEIFYEVICEGLPFHELGKIGYKYVLSIDEFILAQQEWDEGLVEYIKNNSGAYAELQQQYEADNPFPRGTLDFWMNFIGITNDPNSDGWYYEVRMDWSSHSYVDNNRRRPTKIYEDAYVSAWNNILAPTDVVEAKEKERMVEISESNLYNIIQTIAETFGVFCRYEYLYNTNWQITGRKIVFYNNFLNEVDGYIDFTYPNSANAIVREQDSQDISTKMFVRSTDGVNSIMDVEANRLGEDYLLDFDYMLQVGLITNEQYQAYLDFETNIRQLNQQIKKLENTLYVYLDNATTEVQSKYEFNIKKIVAAEELIDTKQKAMEVLQNSGAAYYSPSNAYRVRYKIENNKMIIECEEGNPLRALLRNKGFLFFPTYLAGVQYNLPQSDSAKYLYVNPDKVVYEQQSFGDISVITKITIPSYNNSTPFYLPFLKKGSLDPDSATPYYFSPDGYIYISYTYDPTLEYNLIKQIQEQIIRDATMENNFYKTRLEEIKQKSDSTQTRLDEQLAAKQVVLKIFESIMGPALRESYWQPDNYTKLYEARRQVAFNNIWGANHIIGDAHVEFKWDTNCLLENEATAYYLEEIGSTKSFYYYLQLSNNIIQTIDSTWGLWADIQEEPYLRADFTSGNTTIKRNGKFFPVGSSLELSFLKDLESNARIIAIIKDINVMQYHKPGVTWAWVKRNDNGIFTKLEDVNSNNFFQFREDGILPAHPRIFISDIQFISDHVNNTLLIDNLKLNNFEDYYIAYLDYSNYLNDESEYEGAYTITIKPEALISRQLSSFNHAILTYYSSTELTAIYLDALQILKENSRPKVSYIISANIFNAELIKQAYNLLGRICNINDPQLHFNCLQGYISSLDLDLDNPANDKIEVKNYRTKFEDLFTTIVAQTEAVKKNEFLISAASSAFVGGVINKEILESSFLRADLDFAFNNGNLTINETDGIWANSDSGVVAMTGGGIFTATEKDPEGNWKWNTGILPSGINADLITTGQLNTNLINIYAGSDISFQLNQNGLFAYKVNNLPANEPIDAKQYVVHNQDGLFLIAEKDSKPDGYVNQEGEQQSLSATVQRVAISWDGLTLRNYNNERTFYADAETGDLQIMGTLKAGSLIVGDHFKIDPANATIEIGTATNKMVFNEEGISLGSKKLSVITDNFSINSNATDYTPIFKLSDGERSVMLTPAEGLVIDFPITLTAADRENIIEDARRGWYLAENNSNNLPTGVTNGSLGIVYSLSDTSIDYIYSTIGNSGQTYGTTEPPSSTSGSDGWTTRFGVSARRWNSPYVAQYQNNNLYRIGCSDNPSWVSATVVQMSVNEKSQEIPAGAHVSVTATFFRGFIHSTTNIRDYLYSRVSGAIKCKIVGLTSGQDLSESQSISLPPGSNGSEVKEEKTISFILNKKYNYSTDGNLGLVFFVDGATYTYTLALLQVETCSISINESSQGNAYGLYVYSADNWQKIGGNL